MLKHYINVLKPRESIMLTFIGACAGFVAAGGVFSWKLLLTAAAVLLGSLGANGLTNYLDRRYDALMQRTRRRALPAGYISPPEKSLPLMVGCTVAGLIIAWFLHPACFAAGLIGTLAAVVWRKRWTCVFPQGIIASCAPVLIGWLAFRPAWSVEILLICFLIISWVPLHVWSLMIANREDYINAGLTFFPMSVPANTAVKWLLPFAFMLAGVSTGLYFTGGFGWIYLGFAVVLGVMVLLATVRLAISGISRDAWRLYKFSSIPYLGLIFLAMCIDVAVMA